MSQTWNADQYTDHASFVADYGLPVLDLLNPKAGEKILDLGCGDGALTLHIVKYGARVEGVDSSPSMVRAAQLKGLSVQVSSGERLQFESEFDAVFSNAALHWMKDADAVIYGVANALKAGGRFVGEFGGRGNVAILLSAMREVFKNNPEFGKFANPWYFPDCEEYEQKLINHGFKVHYMELIPRLTTPLNSGLKEWLKIFSNGITSRLRVEQKELFLREVEKTVRPKLLIKGQWIADYVRLRFSAKLAG